MFQKIKNLLQTKKSEEWIHIDTLEALKSLRVDDQIKYTLYIDQEPYTKGKIIRIDIEHYKSFGETAHRLYIQRKRHTDYLLLNCTTGYDIPYQGRGYKLFLYKRK